MIQQVKQKKYIKCFEKPILRYDLLRIQMNPDES